jgi:hypothetical protein
MIGQIIIIVAAGNMASVHHGESEFRVARVSQGKLLPACAVYFDGEKILGAI